MEIGAKRINAKATHFLKRSIAPIRISRIPTMGKTYFVSFKESIKFPAFSGNSGNGMNPKNLFRPKATSISPRIILAIFVNCEFILFEFD